MKTTFIKIFIWISLILLVESTTFAETQQEMLDRQDRFAEYTVIYTSEKVPGANCVCVKSETYSNISEDQTQTDYNNGNFDNNWIQTRIVEDPTEAACWNPTTRKYKCTVQPGLTGFQNIFASIVKTVVYIVMLLGVLAIVGLGIAWAWAGGEDVKMKSNLKHWAVNVLVGLIILFFFRYILTFLAPWIFQ